jgi:hypothetical protein
MTRSSTGKGTVKGSQSKVSSVNVSVVGKIAFFSQQIETWFISVAPLTIFIHSNFYNKKGDER